MNTDQRPLSDDELAEHIAERGTVTYTIRLPLGISARLEADALRRGISATKAVTEAAVRGSYIVPSAEDKP